MNLRIAHLSDIHFGGENPDALAAATAFVQAERPDVVIVTGDLTLFGAPDEFAAAHAWLAELSGDVLCTPGNHDTPWAGLIDRAFAPFQRYQGAVGPASEATIKRDGLIALALNTARGWQLRLNWSKGEISAGQVRRTVDALGDAPRDSIRLLACHHPLLEVAGEPITGGVRGGAWAARQFARAEVDLILNGHLHVPFFTALPYGDRKTFAIGAGTLSLRERAGAPASFNLIELENGAVSVTVIGWENGGLTKDRRWRDTLRARRDPAAPGVTKGIAR